MRLMFHAALSFILLLAVMGVAAVSLSADLEKATFHVA